MDYPALAAELSDYPGMDDGAIAAALVARTVKTAAPGTLMPADFVARFTPEETAAILDSQDALVRAMMLRLKTQQEPLSLTGPTVTQGVAYMAAKGLIEPARVPDILAVPDGPAVARCEQIGCALMLDMDEASRALAVSYAREFLK